MNLILLGAPGAGKGTQAALLEEHTGLVHVASGDLFRAALRDGSELGLQARSYMDRGELVPDGLVIQMIMERISRPDCAGGVIFDGFPRTLEQACALEDELIRHERRVDRVLYLNVPEQMLLRRIAGRQSCRICAAIYNLYYFPSRRPDLCDRCGTTLVRRSDDTLETAQHRLGVYFAQTMPLIQHYHDQGSLVEIDGRRPINEVTEAMVRALSLDQGNAHRAA